MTADDFVMTIADDDDNFPVYDEEDGNDSEEPKEQLPLVKNNNKKQNTTKTKTPNATEQVDLINPDFTFCADAAPTVDGATHPWDFSSARAELRQRMSLVNYTTLDEKIERRRQKDTKKRTESINEEEKDEESDDDEEGFGLGVDGKLDTEEEDPLLSDSEGEEDENEESEESEEEDSDNEDEKDEAADSDDDADEAEEERKRAYFASPDDDDLQTQVPESFQTMNLSRPILRGLAEIGFIQPTIIQARTIPVALLGRDICGGAVTGSGKTAAFIVPIIERLLYRPKAIASTRVLILAPTRELAIQCHSVAERLAKYTDIQFCLAVGGLSLKAQEQKLKQRPDVVIATPGRLIDHLRNSMSVNLDSVEILVMDEADRMLEDGFAAELKEITDSCPKTRQTMLFSATMTDNVDELIRLAMTKPVRLFVDIKNTAARRLTQEFVRVRSHREADRPALLVALCKRTFKEKVIIFCKSKAGAHQMKIVFGLLGMKAAELHGNLTQEQRLEAIELFRDGKVDYLLATDLASRGLDIKGIETVINFNMPQSFAQYLHRVGRTARAGRGGRSVTLVGESDRKMLKMAVKSAPKGSVKNRVVKIEVMEKYRRLVEKLEDEVREVMKEEKEEKLLRQAEMEVKKASNILEHEKEILNRPARTWFQTGAEKQASKEMGAAKHKSAFAEEEGDGVMFGKKRKAENVKEGPKRHPLAGLSRAKKRRIELNKLDEETANPGRKALIKGSVKAAKKSVRPVRMQQFGDGEQLRPTAGQAAQMKRDKEKTKKKQKDVKKERRKSDKGAPEKGKSQKKYENKGKNAKKASGQKRK